MMIATTISVYSMIYDGFLKMMIDLIFFLRFYRILASILFCLNIIQKQLIVIDKYYNFLLESNCLRDCESQAGNFNANMGVFTSGRENSHQNS